MKCSVLTFLLGINIFEHKISNYKSQHLFCINLTVGYPFILNKTSFLWVIRDQGLFFFLAVWLIEPVSTYIFSSFSKQNNLLSCSFTFVGGQTHSLNFHSYLFSFRFYRPTMSSKMKCVEFKKHIEWSVFLEDVSTDICWT